MKFNGYLCPCGMCMACRINKKRLWVHRIILESYCHAESLFVTLTYNDENLPADRSLNPRHLQLFMKRLRKMIYPVKVRFFAVGEYGDHTQRPHYHMALFGVGAYYQKVIEECWNQGFVMIGTLTDASAGYIAGYVTKKMTKVTDFPDGRHPEFARMSNRPGIGVPALTQILDVLKRSHPDVLSGDVPKVLRHGDKFFPLGRLLRGKLRNVLFSEEKIQLLKEIAKDEVQTLSRNLLSTSEFMKATQGLQDYLVELRLQNPGQEINLKSKLRKRYKL